MFPLAIDLTKRRIGLCLKQIALRRQAGDSHFGNEAPDTMPLEVKAAERGVPLQTVALNDADVIKAYERRLVLVRPDGHVAWRGNEVPQNPWGLIDRVCGG
jgi:hypothetical protein